MPSDSERPVEAALPDVIAALDEALPAIVDLSDEAAAAALFGSKDLRRQVKHLRERAPETRIDVVAAALRRRQLRLAVLPSGAVSAEGVRANRDAALADLEAVIGAVQRMQNSAAEVLAVRALAVARALTAADRAAAREALTAAIVQVLDDARSQRGAPGT